MATEPADRAWTVEAYRPGDEAHILELFRREFGVERSEAHWRWQFLDNPYGGPFISLAWHRERRFLVGNQVLMPFPLNLGGTRALAGHSLDLVVHHDFRRQGVFEHTAKHAFANLRAAGGVALVAFPNAASYPGFVRTLGWRRILEPVRWTLRLGVRGKLARRLGAPLAALGDAAYRAGTAAARGAALAAARRATPALAVAHADRLPDGVDALWAREARAAALSLWKDRTYLAWRYERHPDHRFTFHALTRGGALAGLGVSVVVAGVALVCELIVPDRDPDAGRRLALETARHCGDAGAEEVRFLGHDAGFLARALRDFAAAPAPENVFVGRAIADEALTARLADASAWTLAYGDGDFV